MDGMTDKELALTVELLSTRLAALNSQGRALTAELNLTKLAVQEVQGELREHMAEQEKRAKDKEVKPEPPAKASVEEPQAE